MSLVPLSDLFPAGRPADTVMVERDGTTLRFARLAADVAAAAGQLQRRSVRRALLLAEDSYWFLVGLFALLQVDAEIVMPPNAQPGTLEALREPGDLLLTDQPGPETGKLVLGQDSPDRDVGEAWTLRPLAPERCRFSFFTSGSTGERKRIGKTLAQLETEIRTLESLWGETLGDAGALGTVSHQHIFGLTFRLLWPVMAGRPVAARVHLAWENLLAALARPEILVVSPAHLTRIDGLVPLRREIRPRGIFTAGAPLSFAAAQEAAALLGEFPIEIFGSTETGAIAWRQQGAADTPWRPLPRMEVTTGAEGTLELRSPFLEPGEVYRSADRIELVTGGFHFRGRIDRVAKIEGKRVGLAEVERDLLAIPWVREAAVIALSGRRSALAAAIVLSPEGRDALAQHGKFRFERRLRQALGATQDWAGLPRRWRFVDALPRDGMGKCPAAAVEALFSVADGKAR